VCTCVFLLHQESFDIILVTNSSYQMGVSQYSQGYGWWRSLSLWSVFLMFRLFWSSVAMGVVASPLTRCYCDQAHLPMTQHSKRNYQVSPTSQCTKKTRKELFPVGDGCTVKKGLSLSISSIMICLTMVVWDWDGNACNYIKGVCKYTIVRSTCACHGWSVFTQNCWFAPSSCILDSGC
jgi:hypothetical protein